MSRFLPIVIAAAALASGCGATTRATTTTAPNPAFPSLTSAVATFVSTQHGKDAGSPLTIQLLRTNAELAADIQVTGVKFDDHSSSGPFAFSMRGPFDMRDIDNGQLRVRFTPDGSDDWTFDLHLTMRFSDGTARNFLWRGVRLDNASSERVLNLAAARVP